MRRLHVAPLLVLLLALSSCGLNSGTSSTQEVTEFGDLEVPRGFDWSSSTAVELNVSISPEGAFPVTPEGSVLELLDAAGVVIDRTLITAGRARFSLKAPPTVTEASLYFPLTHNWMPLGSLRGDITMRVGLPVYGTDNGLLYRFPENAAPPAAGKLAQSVNLLSNGDFSQGSDLPYIDSHDAPLSLRGVWHKTRLDQSAWEPVIRSGQLDIGHPQLGDTSVVLQDINVEPGRQVILALQLRQPAANEGIRADIVLSALSGNAPAAVINMFRIDAGAQDYKTWTPVVVSGIVPDWANGLRVMIVTLPSTKKYYVDTAIELDYADLADSGEPIDTDSDGVVDSLDPDPLDPDAAQIGTIPYVGFTVNAFEDMWPEQGDYDFNDMVVQHRISFVRDNRSRLVRADVELVINAVGALYHNGLALRFLVSIPDGAYRTAAPSMVTNVSGRAAGLHPLVANTVLVTDDIFSILEIFFQNNGEGPSGGPEHVSFRIHFDKTHPDASESLVPDLFIFRTSEPGREIHLPGHPATAAADPSYYGTEADATAPGAGLWYETATGLPWALEIVPGEVQFLHPKERISITRAFPGFADWARSGGQQKKSWYKTPEPEYVFSF
jgi:LruC domain-containing protein